MGKNIVGFNDIFMLHVYYQTFRSRKNKLAFFKADVKLSITEIIVSSA